MKDGKIGAFDVFMRMIETDDKSFKLSPLSNIVAARKVRQGTDLTIGVGEDICGKILADELVGGLILVDRKRFSAAKQLALMAGIPVVKSKGAEVVRVSKATAAYLFGPHHVILVGPICSCLSFRLPHEISRHRELRFGESDWRTWLERRDVGIIVQSRRIERTSRHDFDGEEWFA